MSLIVQKYGGSSVATPEQILSIARRVAELHKNGKKLIVVVSAMGDSTDDLLELAAKVSETPHRRELDMLLSTGERVSMALLSMALIDQGVPAISFTGSQAGILTDSSHNNARIQDVRPIRVREELDRGNVVVLAGFQGVNPDTKEITTLGRGGSDLTAVAMAAHFKADRCEILKDVDGVFTADPRVVPTSRRLTQIPYEPAMEMMYWGSQVLHFRALELAQRLGLPIYIGLAHENGSGTVISGEENNMYEQTKVLSVNSHTDIRRLHVTAESLGKALSRFHHFLRQKNLPWPQILDTQMTESHWEFLMTGPTENLNAIETSIRGSGDIRMDGERWASVAATCAGAVSSDLPQKITEKLESSGVTPKKMLLSPLSVVAVVNVSDRNKATQALHELI